MIAALLAAAVSAGVLELGGNFGAARLLGEADPAEGRSGAVVEAVQEPVGGAAWVGWEWSPRNVVGLRWLVWSARAPLTDPGDLGSDAEEDFGLTLVGPEVVRRFGSGRLLWSLGGGVGYARVRDELDAGGTSLVGRGTGTGAWGRGAAIVPLGSGLEVLAGFQTAWLGFGRIKAEDQPSWSSDYVLVQGDLGLGFRF